MWYCRLCFGATSTTTSLTRCVCCTSQIREHAAQAAAPGRPERANDVKLSRGGIREVEFTVQLLQVVRGGQFPELRTRPTRRLHCKARGAPPGLMPQATADALTAAYVFLRRVEHRIQYLDDQQTHVLATNDNDLAWIAQTMGFADCCAFLSELDTHRELVAQEFDTLLGKVPTRMHQGRLQRQVRACSSSGFGRPD
jgi:glutamate-ammonia-ligase adenylyltransferase